MATLRALIREFFISTGDPREPVKMVLGDMWDNVFTPRNQKDLLVDALYESLLVESDGKPMAWSKPDLAKMVNIETEDIDLAQLDEGTLARELQRRFRDVALVPDRAVDSYDFEQIARNVIARAFSIFEAKLRIPENQKLWMQLIESYARANGSRVSELDARLASALNEWSGRLAQAETMGAHMQGIVEELSKTLKEIRDSGILDQKTNENNTRGDLTPEEVTGLKRQLSNYETSLRLYDVRWSMYADPRNVPPEEQRAAMLIMQKVDEILRRLRGN